MLQSWLVLTVGLGYLALMFAVANWGNRLARHRHRGTPRPFIYALSLAVYCTSWTYFGSVGGAARSGFEFLAIYLGPILLFALGWRMLQKVAEIAKRQNIASIADFLSARYGKSEFLGALAAIVATLGVVPYISIQLKAVSQSLQTLILAPALPDAIANYTPRLDGVSLLVTVTLGLFAILYGTRHIDTTEHQDGMIFAISMESVVKLVAFMAVGLFVTLSMLGGVGKLGQIITSNQDISALLAQDFNISRWLTLTLLSAFAVILLPRQFHVTIVENTASSDIRHAAWAFPLYLVLINLFVLPIAIAGLLLLPQGSDGDMFVLNLPAAAGSPFFTMVAFVGGLSAATAMVVVESVALSIMISNNLVVPLLLRRRAAKIGSPQNMGRTLVRIRRLAIACVLVLAYGYYRMIGSSAALSQVGLISFAAVAQFAPAFIGALLWRRATAWGAVAGILAGTFVWAYTLLLPSFADAGWIDSDFILHGPFGVEMLRPRQVLGLSSNILSHGVFWSLLTNLLLYVVFSLLRQPSPIERLQATGFITRDFGSAAGKGFRLWRTTVSVERLEQTVARYLGPARAHAAFKEFMQQRGHVLRPEQEADVRTIRFAENLLARAVGVSSSRLVMALLLERHSASPRGAMQLLDDASTAIQHNRDILQSAIDNVEQGIAVFDSGLNLSCWNAKFQSFLHISPELERVGTPLPEIIRSFLRQTLNGEAWAEDRLRKITLSYEAFREDITATGQVIEVRSHLIPDGGIVMTFMDATESVRAAEALQRSHDELEQRVLRRTRELTDLNQQLVAAKAEAEAANQGKTRFIAAASHDVLQSLNAARLFTSSLVDRLQDQPDSALARNVDASLEGVEEILSALLDIARLDAGAMQPELSLFRIDDLLQSLTTEYGPFAASKALQLTAVPCGLTVESDRKLLRRILQNFVSNAVKYTVRGRVLIGCRRQGQSLSIEVHDTGIGIAAEKQAIVFEEFQRLGDDGGVATGLGLGLSIVARIAHILNTDIILKSKPQRGSMFAARVPLSSISIPKPLLQQARPRPGLVNASHVLVIDNETAILQGMNLLLQGWGCTVLLAKSAAEAISAAGSASSEIDIILADYHLDDGNGIAVISQLRRRLRRPLPAILITADRSTEVADQALAHDIHMLRKPVKPAALRAAMAHVQSKALVQD